MKFDNKIYQKIWDLALPYQDKRDDEGHAEAVVKCAQKLLGTEDADPNIVIPAAILHDIGWSQVPKEEAMLIFGKVEAAERIKIQRKHEENGVKMARQILDKVNYEKSSIDKILEIIDGHDTRKEFLSKEDGVVRDADKFGGRFDRRAFKIDMVRWNQSAKERADYLRNKYFAMPDFLYSQSARELAEKELKAREEEFVKEK